MKKLIQALSIVTSVYLTGNCMMQEQGRPEQELFFQQFAGAVAAQPPYTFTNVNQQESILTCDGFQFVGHMQGLAASIQRYPEVVTRAFEVGFACSHVPYLLVYNGHLYDKFMQIDYCCTTADFRDLLKIIVITEIRALVDAWCIDQFKKSLTHSIHNEFIQQNTSHAKNAASYLKNKLVTLWKPFIVEAYQQSSLPTYKTVLEEVEKLSKGWLEAYLMHPLWVCCVKQQSGMWFNNLVASWSGEKYGNWWNPDQGFVKMCLESSFNSRNEKTTEILERLKQCDSWDTYFAPCVDANKKRIIDFSRISGKEYDSDGEF